MRVRRESGGCVHQCINPCCRVLSEGQQSESPDSNMDIGTVNALPYEDFVNIFGNVVEKCPIITAHVWSRRPFANLAALEAAISDFIEALPDSGKEGILRCHPDLAGRDLQSGMLTKESREEQARAGPDALSSAEVWRITRLNEEYKRRFGSRLSSVLG